MTTPVHNKMFLNNRRGVSVANFLMTLSMAGAATVAAVFVPHLSDQQHADPPVSSMVEALDHLQEAYNNWTYLGGSISAAGGTQRVSIGKGAVASEAAAVFVQLITAPKSHRMIGSFSDGLMTALDSSGSCNSTTVQMDSVKVVYDEQQEDLNTLHQLNSSRQQVSRDFSANTFYVTVVRDVPSQCYYVTPSGFVEQVRLGTNGVMSFHHPVTK